MHQRETRVTAVLGPTNTGKTHYAIERMLGHKTGVIGLPLRLLAREVFDRVVALRGPSVVALVTGEERIVPARAAYWVCTVEAMPVDFGADFLAVDEIQLCADPDRGYIFTDRLLHARGWHETLFLGSETMRGRIASLIPGVTFQRRERFSKLTYAGAKKLSRMPPRSAIVGFSVDNVYAIAELVRRQKGGAAVVMGALSPRTRNAQVALYQNGDVDHLVATDAIGMGLNLDIRHVAFSGLAKFDGRRHRHLAPNELAQIAGRAGRYTDDGTFGVTGEAPALEPEVVAAIEAHRFTPIQKLQWRNADLEFGTPDRLIAALEAPAPGEGLVRGREADDLATLKTLWDLPAIRDRVRGGPDVRLLWDVCQIPDFRKLAVAEHATLCQRIFEFLHETGHIPADWLARQIQRIDKTTGDIDTLSRRLAFIRTWTYVAQRPNWVRDTTHWRAETRAVEDRLSDALHTCLTQRFVDRRTSVLMRRLKQRESLVADVNEKGEVHIEDQYIGRLEGFRFQLDPSADPVEAKTLRAAGVAALQPAFNLRSDKFYNAPDTEIDVTEQGGLMWGEYAVGQLTPGADALSPHVRAFVDDEAGADVAEKVRRRLQHWIDRRIAALFEPLLALRDDAALTGMARGLAFRLVEGMGVLPRSEVAADVKALEQESRALLRKHSVRFGQFTLFQPLMLKPAPTRLRLVLWGLASGLDDFPSAPPPGLVTVPAVLGAPGGYYSRAGYRLSGARAIRIDMLERLADLIRAQDTRKGFEATPDMLSITGLTLDQFADLMQGMGYAAEKGERAKSVKPPQKRPDAETAGAKTDPAARGGGAGHEAKADPSGTLPLEGDAAPIGDGAPAETQGSDTTETLDAGAASAPASAVPAELAGATTAAATPADAAARAPETPATPSVPQPATPTPTSETSAPTPASEISDATSASETSDATPGVETSGATPGSETSRAPAVPRNSENTDIAQPSGDTTAPQPADDTPAPQPSGDPVAPEPLNAAGATDPTGEPATLTPAVDPQDAPADPSASAPSTDMAPVAATALRSAAPETMAEPDPGDSPDGQARENDATPVEQEVFYTFTWAPRRRAGGQERGNAKKPGNRPPQQPQKGKKRRPPQSAKQDGKRGEKKPQPPRSREKPIDPDNPFAALMVLKEKR